MKLYRGYDPGDLYGVQKKDLRKAGLVLADAFEKDPVWKNLFEGIALERRGAFFESPVRYGLKFGTVRASSENLEGIAVWAPGDYADVTLWRGFRTGFFSSVFKMGMMTATRLMKMMGGLRVLEEDRKSNMRGRDHVYLMVLGVASGFQGQGFGGKLLRVLLVTKPVQGRYPKKSEVIGDGGS